MGYWQRVRGHVNGRTVTTEHLVVEMMDNGCLALDVEKVSTGENGKMFLSRTVTYEAGKRLGEGTNISAAMSLSEIDQMK